MSYTYKCPRPAVTADCIVITLELEPKVLLIERRNEPFKGCWAFPGGFMEMNETLAECAIRELEEETGLVANTEDIFSIGTFSKVDRDPRGRSISQTFLTLVEAPIEVKAQDDAAKAKWWPLNELPTLAFDHEEIMKNVIELYRILTNAKISEKQKEVYE